MTCSVTVRENSVSSFENNRLKNTTWLNNGRTLHNTCTPQKIIRFGNYFRSENVVRQSIDEASLDCCSSTIFVIIETQNFTLGCHKHHLNALANCFLDCFHFRLKSDFIATLIVLLLFFFFVCLYCNCCSDFFVCLYHRHHHFYFQHFYINSEPNGGILIWKSIFFYSDSFLYVLGQYLFMGGKSFCRVVEIFNLCWLKIGFFSNRFTQKCVNFNFHTRFLYRKCCLHGVLHAHVLVYVHSVVTFEYLFIIYNFYIQCRFKKSLWHL